MATLWAERGSGTTDVWFATLGLPTVKQIVHQHGGTIEIVSEVGCGTLVRVTLPLTRAVAVEELAA